ncbi:MAG: flagellar biosynthesis protein FlgC [Desulfobulbaceae bacterium]|nr:flagellar biosynthesis protein FlgC [Desulfobulbaceae bacterium]MCK5340346.1 flagellar biosynthesis protein FlgC [Desulfobulbaceae bacterium]
MISGVNAAISGLLGFQKKLESTANNIANLESDGFKKTKVTLEEGDLQGVNARVQRIDDPGPMVLEPTPEGVTLVEKSNVDLTEEIPNLILSRRFYQANIKTIQTVDEMLGNLLDIKS